MKKTILFFLSFIGCFIITSCGNSTKKDCNCHAKSNGEETEQTSNQCDCCTCN